MSKLCILGEDMEPCFEGSQITKVQFSFDDESKELWTDFICQMKEIINEGGTPVFNTYAVTIGDSLWNAIYSHITANYPAEDTCSEYSVNGVFEDDGQTFAVLQTRDNTKYYRMNFSMVEDNFSAEELVDITENYTPAEEPLFALADVEAFESEFKKKDKDEDKKPADDDSQEEDKPAEDGEDKPAEEDKSDSSEDKKDDEAEEDEEDKKKKQKKYNLEEVEEYAELLSRYNALNDEHTALLETVETMNAEMASLREFKNGIDHEKKMNMINNDFCMLDESLKKDVIDHVDEYSLDDIEAKLSIICVRNKVSFNLDDNKQNDSHTFNIDNVDDDTSVPAWIKAVRDVAKTKNI